MLSAYANSRLSIAGLSLVLAGCLVLPSSLSGEHDPAPQQTDQEASPQPATVQLPAATQAKLDKLQDALTAAHAAGDAKAEANALIQIGDLYFRAQDFQKAIVNYRQALAMARSLNDDIEQVRMLTGIARCYRGLLQNQKALEPFQQALDLASASGDERGQADGLIGIGNVHSFLGDKQEALEYFNRALPILRKSGDRSREAITLNNIGEVYSDIGERQKALDYFNQALPITRDLRDRAREAGTLIAIGEAYSALGQKQKALDIYNHALPIELEINSRSGQGAALMDIGEIYYDLGDKQKALDYLNQALSIQRQVNNRFLEAQALGNIGIVYMDRRDWQKALDCQNQALEIFRQLKDGKGQGRTLNNIGAIYGNLGDYQKALGYYNQVMPIFRQRNFSRGEANTLNNIANMYGKLGDRQKALEYRNQALALAAIVGDPLLESQILIRLMVNQADSQPSLAVFYGKQAVNLLQQVRSNIKELDEDLQKSFLVSKEGYYHALANLLIAQGRLPEAEQVLDLEKQQEYSDYVRGEAANAMSPLAMTPAELQAEQEYQKSTATLVSMGEQWEQLSKNTAPTAEQEKQLKELTDQLAQASEGLNVFYSRLYALFGKASSANNQVRDVKGPVSELKEIIAEMPHTVALYTLVGTDRTSIIVIAGAADVPAVVRESEISEVELNKKVLAFQQVLRQPGQDPRPLAQELYKILIGPVKADLDQAKAETLVWQLDGTLRYVPLAALYDGKQYLVENYNTATISPTSIANLAQPPKMGTMSTVAMGISQKYEEGLGALPAVEGELDDVVKDAKVKGANGALEGTILLNGQFTQKAMENQLRGQPTVVHIASHFVYSPVGDATKSYLLLAGEDQSGAAFHLTVKDFRDDVNLRLRGTALLTLSACDTGMSGNESDGKEVDGLGMTAEYKGAKAVISSLWSVNDASTGQLMGDFYKRWADGAGKVTKAEALRQAQLDLLLGKARAQGDGSKRGFATAKPQPVPPAGYAHPFYWAPFVLMGNWK
jgi:CHAT domain-containing protein/Tfp pilus assembly protein PilF